MPFPATRAIALFLGSFSILNVIVGRLFPEFDQNLWWIDLRVLPAPLPGGLLAAGGTLLVGFALRPEGGRLRRRATMLVVGILIAASLWNAVTFYSLLARGTIRSGFPLALSLLVMVALAGVVRSVLAPSTPAPVRRPFLRAGAVLVLCFALFPFAQMMCFGKTDYRRPADAVVVFGCRTYADGRPSDALADRVRTACRLYHDGLAPVLVFSGGPGDGFVHETEAMRSLALRLGVPDRAILLDPCGLNTSATVRETAPLFSRLGFRRVLAVSHFYHLPRVKMAYQRAGVEVYTVPATESYLLTQMPWLLAREVAALWVYYLKPAVA